MTLFNQMLKVAAVATAALAVSVAHASPQIASAVETQIVNATRVANVGLSAAVASQIGAGLKANLSKNGLSSQANAIANDIANTLNDRMDLKGLSKDERVKGLVIAAEAMSLTTESNSNVQAILGGDLVKALNDIEGDSSLDNKADHMKKSIEILEAYVANLKRNMTVSEAINAATTDKVGHDAATVAKGCGIKLRD